MPLGVTLSPAKSFDVAVIGAGAFGSWTAYFLRKSGASVALLDSYGPANARASSGGESRIIRMGYGADEIYTRSSMRALPLWQELFAQAGQPALFQRTGVLWIAYEKEKYSLDTLATLQKAGAKFEKLSRDELSRRYPQIVFDDDAWAIFEPDSGVLLARRAVQAVVEQARKIGVDYREEAALPPRLNQTVADKFADQLPMWLWPKIRILYYTLSAVTIILVVVGLVYLTQHHALPR